MFMRKRRIVRYMSTTRPFNLLKHKNYVYRTQSSVHSSQKNILFLHFKDQPVNPEREIIPVCRKSQTENANKLSNTTPKSPP